MINIQKSKNWTDRTTITNGLLALAYFNKIKPIEVVKFETTGQIDPEVMEELKKLDLSVNLNAYDRFKVLVEEYKLEYAAAYWQIRPAISGIWNNENANGEPEDKKIKDTVTTTQVLFVNMSTSVANFIAQTEEIVKSLCFDGVSLARDNEILRKKLEFSNLPWYKKIWRFLNRMAP